MKARLYLEDGTLFEGVSFGASATLFGEVVFNTGMTGYQEILTDPSYGGQIVTMTYPLIGNYGVNKEDVESDKVQVTGFVVKEYAEIPSHWQCDQTLSEYLEENNIPGISGIDTRKLTKLIRNKGTMNCILTTEEITDEMIEKLGHYEFPKDIVAQVSCSEIESHQGAGIKVGLIDLGLKKGILKQLLNLDCSVTVFPHDTNYETVASYDLDVVMFSNGPGDPKEAKAAIKLAKELIGQKSLWGICLGHQVLALALGADTYKLKFGHRGANHPVIEHETGKVFMSSQNHGYAVDGKSFTDEMIVTFTNVNDDTIEGLGCPSKDITSVQFHPEEGPGPEDAHYIFAKWVTNYKKGGALDA